MKSNSQTVSKEKIPYIDPIATEIRLGIAIVDEEVVELNRSRILKTPLTTEEKIFSKKK